MWERGRPSRPGCTRAARPAWSTGPTGCPGAARRSSSGTGGCRRDRPPLRAGRPEGIEEMAKLKFGVWIPTYAWADDPGTPESVRANVAKIKDSIVKCEEHGIDD